MIKTFLKKVLTGLLSACVAVSAFAQITTSSLGGRVGIPDRKAVEQFLADGTISVSDLEQRKKHYGEVMHLG